MRLELRIEVWGQVLLVPHGVILNSTLIRFPLTFFVQMMKTLDVFSISIWEYTLGGAAKTDKGYYASFLCWVS